jgi:PPP family 3-phenylpropionic acid transporter
MGIPYWRLSSFYFFYFAVLGSFLPYWGLYLKECHFSAKDIGQLTALLVGTKIIAPNIWGWLADWTGRSLRIIRLTSFFAAVIFSGFLFFYGYVWVAWLTVAFSFFWNAALPQFEAATLAHIRLEPQRYSRIRLWGSVGFIVAVLGIGQFLELQSILLLPFIITLLLVLSWFVSLTVPEARMVRHALKSAGIWQIIKKPAVIAFLLANMMLQIAHAPYYVFYSIYLKEYHYAESTIGLLWGLGVFAEIILFMFIGRIFKTCSVRNCLLISIFLSVLRWSLVAWFVDYLSVLIVAQVLHAASFGSVHVSAMHFIQNKFGQQHQGKGQALYASVAFGLGGMVGSFYSGYFWQTLGAQLVFSMAAVSCAVALIIVYIWVDTENPQKS